MNPHLRDAIIQATGADDLLEANAIQDLWSGYGSIDRYGLIGAKLNTVVVKHVHLADQPQHPRGWNTDLSHQRKLRSYQVETAWYKHWASRCDGACRVPQCLALDQGKDEVLMIMEDLDGSGYPLRKTSVSNTEMEACLSWLAHFHGAFMGEQPTGLWDIGTYWNLDTRPDEWAIMEEGALKQSAALLDRTLNEASFQSFVHGDAKLANFCFSSDGQHVAAVDFQYVGGGCGMKDVAYFISSCLNEDECQHKQEHLLNVYFTALNQALTLYQPNIDPVLVETEWRPLYAVAWADFYRFLKGWSPNHWKVHSYSEQITNDVVARLKTQS